MWTSDNKSVQNDGETKPVIDKLCLLLMFVDETVISECKV